MEFRTPISLQPQEPRIDYHSKVFLLGSCFVENIGEKMEYYKLQNFRNPFGILYHPAALEKFLEKVATSATYSKEDIFFHNERWHCFDAHSELSDPNDENLLKNLNSRMRQTREFLREASHIIITLGTAWGYRSRESREMVANCHKLPQKLFSKEIMGVADAETSLRAILEYLDQINPWLVVIFTVSPVRHLKDGIVGNQRSKAHLISAVHNLQEIKVNRENLFYFPAYEIMMDDLRDYRFYAEDMLHPSPAAIDYIWKVFLSSWLSTTANSVLGEVETIQRGLSHRPFNAASIAHQKFLRNLEDKMKKLKEKFPHIKFKNS